MDGRRLAVLDANVLFTFQLRNLLLHLAAEGAYDPLWSEEIIVEVSRSLVAHAGLTEHHCARLLQQMRTYFPHAWGTCFHGSADDLALPDPDDRHVVALAIQFEADVIVTCNLRHIPAAVLGRFGIAAQHPDEFCISIADSSPSIMLRAAEQHRCSLKTHPLTRPEYLRSIEAKARLPRTARRLEAAGFLLTPALAG